MAKKWDKRQVLRTIRSLVFIFGGSFLLAFGDAAFLEPLGLVTGGVISIGIIVQYYVPVPVVDFVTWGLQIVLLIVSFIFLGKKFTMHTILATLLYPLFFTLLYRIPVHEGLSVGRLIASQLTGKVVTSVDFANGSFITTNDYSLRILAGLAGGASVGLGVAICYFGDGSTGGLDVLSVIIARKTPIKEALSAFAMDASLVIAGMICMQNIPNGLVGILSAFVCAIAVQFVYVNANSYVIADIVSVEYEKIMEYVHQEMDHGSTLVDVTGGFSGKSHVLLRVAFNKRELYDFKYFIAKTDPKAFVTFTQASMITGEGFDPLPTARNRLEELVAARDAEQQQEEQNDGR
jgi:uncharacterized membrane-anchored protein YitT (DUF2179 family)